MMKINKKQKEELWDMSIDSGNSTTPSNIIILVLQEEREKISSNLFEEILAENFPNLEK